MSDVRAEPLPEQSPSPEPSDAASGPDPLAGDWSEGLPGPLRPHGLPLPARLGEPRAPAAPPADVAAGAPDAQDPGWAMAPPAPQTAAEPTWTAHAHDAGFAPVTPALESVTVPVSAAEAWEESKHEEFYPRTAWSLFNAFTEVQKGSPPRAQMEGSLRLSALFRRELQLA